MERRPLLSVAFAPHTHDGSSVSEIYLHQFYALVPAAVAGVVVWGIGGLRTMLLAIGCALIFEWICARLTKRPECLADGSVLVQGLMLGMLLHAESSWWLIAIGALLMIVLGKYFFGGLGAYPFPPVLLSYAILLFSWPSRLNLGLQMAHRPLDFPPLEPLVATQSFGGGAAQAYSLSDLLLGQQLSGVGASMVLLLLLGGIYLMMRGFIAWRTPLAFLASLFLFGWILHATAPANYPPPLFHLCSGIAVFAAFFLITDFSCSPVNPWAQVVYGVGGGLLAILIRSFGVWPDGTVFAVLLLCLVQPLIDKIHPRAIGVEVPAR